VSVCEMERRVVAGSLTISVTIEADQAPCEHCEEHADEVALLVSTLADEDDSPAVLAHKIAGMFLTVSRVNVVDENGSGCTVRNEH
jgi:hypothetical protein